MMVAGYPDHFTAPLATGIIRKKGEALIDLRAEADTITSHLALFQGFKG